MDSHLNQLLLVRSVGVPLGEDGTDVNWLWNKRHVPKYTEHIMYYFFRPNLPYATWKRFSCMRNLLSVRNSLRKAMQRFYVKRLKSRLYALDIFARDLVDYIIVPYVCF